MPADGSVVEKVNLYAEERASTMWQAGAMLATCFVFLAVARSPDFQLDGLFGIDAAIHNGYLGAYGHFILAVMIAIHSWRMTNCLELRERVLADVESSLKQDTEHRHTEQFLLRLPFEHDLPHFGGRHRIVKQSAELIRPLLSLAPIMPCLIGSFVYAVFLINYFRFYEPGHESDWFSHLFFGGTFRAQWDLRMGDNHSVVINAPLQTLFSVGFGAFLVYRLYILVIHTSQVTAVPLVDQVGECVKQTRAIVEQADEEKPAPSLPDKKTAAKPKSGREIAPADKLIIQDYILTLGKGYGAIAIAVATLLTGFLYTAMHAIARDHVREAVESATKALEGRTRDIDDSQKALKGRLDTTTSLAAAADSQFQVHLQRLELVSADAARLRTRIDEITKNAEELDKQQKARQSEIETILGEAAPGVLALAENEFKILNTSVSQLETRVTEVEKRLSAPAGN